MAEYPELVSNFIFACRKRETTLFFYSYSIIFLRMCPRDKGQTQIQTLKYGLDDAMRIKKKDLVLIEYSFTSYSDMNFQPIWMPKGILTKIWSRNRWSLVTIIILSML